MTFTYQFVIGNLSQGTTVESLTKFLELDKENFRGKAFTSVKLAVKKNGQPLGMAFITIPVGMKKHVLGFNHQVLDGQTVTVKSLYSRQYLLKHNRWVMQKDGVITSRSLRPKCLRKCSLLKSRFHMYDFGANLLHRKFLKDVDNLIIRGAKFGVTVMVIPGCCIAQSEKALALSKHHVGQLYCTAGIHPHFVDQYNADSIPAIRNIAIEKHCIAIGPAGMDFIHDNSLSSKEKQREVFEAQVKLACEIGNRPIYVYERGAHSEVLTILTKNKGKLAGILVHDFSGTPAQAEAYVKIGCYIGVTGDSMLVESREGMHTSEFLAKVPLEQILLESYGRKCPTVLPPMADVLAKTFNTSIEEVTKKIKITSKHFIWDLTKPNSCKLATDELSYIAVICYLYIFSCLWLLFYLFFKYVFNLQQRNT